ncbi:MAG: hypothetical protein KME47_01680 [Nodosilinea sp. WJT8-NPBG4]|jgi:hypothetical protein|nr:hypothetical protein [Nodosilinea sp. WJT8-NPBG4]
MKPDLTQFSRAVAGKISESGQKSTAYKAVLDLFQTAGSFYRTLDSMTSDNLSHFKSSNKYLTERQEKDALALTAMYAGNLRTQFLHDLVKEGSALTDTERQVLEMSLELYKATCEPTTAH